MLYSLMGLPFLATFHGEGFFLLLIVSYIYFIKYITLKDKCV